MDAGVVVAAGLARGDEQRGDLRNLLRTQDAVLVEGVAGVVEEVRVGRRGDGLAVVRLELGPDRIRVVAEIEDEGAVLALGAAVEPT